MANARSGIRPLVLCVVGGIAMMACRDQNPIKASVQQGAKVPEANDQTAIRRRFEEAAACGDRYHCPPADDLLARAERTDGTPVAVVAFELMSDPHVRSFDRLGTVAYEVSLSWVGARVKGGILDAEQKRLFLDAVRRILSADSSTFVEPVYTYFAGPIGDAIPEAKEILTQEALNPRRDLAQMDMAAKVLQRFIHDLTQVRTWLESDDERRQLAAISLLDYMDHRRIPEGEEVKLLAETARRPGVPSAVAMALIGHSKIHDGDAFQPVLEPLLRHSDPQVREAAKAAAKNSS
jgi:hypothetical protein